MNKIIYSLSVMQRLVEMGNIPIAQIPNPKYAQYNCWVFEVTDKFKIDVDKVLMEASGNGIQRF